MSTATPLCHPGLATFSETARDLLLRLYSLTGESRAGGKKLVDFQDVVSLIFFLKEMHTVHMRDSKAERCRGS